MERTATIEASRSAGGGLALVSTAGRPFLGYMARLGAGSRSTMAICLANICRCDPAAFPWENLRREHTLVIRAYVAESYAPATASKHMAALRGILKECWRSGLIGGDDYARAVDLPAIRGNSARAGRALAAEELDALFHRSSVDGVRGARDGALLALLYGAGLRVAEAVHLELKDLAPDRKSLSVRGKGGKVRTAWLVAGADRLLVRWIALRGEAQGPVVCPVRGSTIELRGMGEQAVLERCAWLAAKCRLAKFTPHDLRRSYASDLIDAGADLSIVQQLMGHSKVTTTQQYDRRGERSKASAAAKVTIGS